MLDEYSVFCQMPEHLREELAVYLGYIVDEDDETQDDETIGSVGLKAVCLAVGETAILPTLPLRPY